MTYYIVDMIFYKTKGIIVPQSDQEREITERIRNGRRTRIVKGRYFKGLRQLTLGQYTVSLNMLVAYQAEEFFIKWYNQLLSVDKRAMEMAGYDVTNENEWREIDSDFKHMVEIMNTNEDVKQLYDTYGDSYITGFLFTKI